MGLDSIELLVEIETYFNIQIPDQEAESIVTIQKMVDKVAEHLNIQRVDSSLKQIVFNSLANKLNKNDYNIQLNDKIASFLNTDGKSVWADLELSTGLTLPRPDNYNSKSNKLSDKFKSLIGWTPNYDWSQISVSEFVDAVCACNYLKLVDKSNLKSKYDIYIAVTGITVDKIGVEYFEISPEKSFTADLGVD